MVREALRNLHKQITDFREFKSAKICVKYREYLIFISLVVFINL